MSPPSPLDTFVDPTHGVVTKCPVHQHIRECFLIEMDRVVAKDQLRFQHSMRVLAEEVCPRFGFSLLDGNDHDNGHDAVHLSMRVLAEEVCPHFGFSLLDGNDHDNDNDNENENNPELRNSVHDPRFRYIVEKYASYRLTIPMTLDEHDLPILRPPTQQYAVLDIMENLRLALDERDRLHLISEKSKRRARNAHILLTSAMGYIRTLKNLVERTGGAERAVFDCGLVAAMDTERQAVYLATSIIEEHFEDKENTNEVLHYVTKRMASYLDVLDAHKNTLNCDVLTSVAIASNMRLFQASLLWAGYQTMQPLETFAIPNVAEPTAEEKSAWTHETVKTAAVRQYIIVERALDAVKSDMAAIGRHVSIEFDMYPKRNLSTGDVTFVVDECAYTDVPAHLSG
ncbi:MAG: hypothetical protein STHCBS139747_006856 [Sporothrix thermara]